MVMPPNDEALALLTFSQVMYSISASLSLAGSGWVETYSDLRKTYISFELQCYKGYKAKKAMFKNNFYGGSISFCLLHVSYHPGQKQREVRGRQHIPSDFSRCH